MTYSRILGLLLLSVVTSRADGTKTASTPVSYAPANFTALQLFTPAGIILVQLDSSLVLDTSGAVPVLRAAPTVVPVPVRKTDTFHNVGGTSPMTLTAVPSSTFEPLVFRNGLIQEPGMDYTLTGQSLAFKAEVCLTVTDSVMVIYYQ